MPMYVCLYIRSLPPLYNYSHILLSCQVLLISYKLMTCISVTVQDKEAKLRIKGNFIKHAIAYV